MSTTTQALTCNASSYIRLGTATTPIKPLITRTTSQQKIYQEAKDNARLERVLTENHDKIVQAFRDAGDTFGKKK